MAFVEVGRHSHGVRKENDQKPGEFQTVIHGRRQWRLDPADGQYKRNRTTTEANDGADGVSHAAGIYRAIAPEFFELLADDGSLIGSKETILEKATPGGQFRKVNISGQKVPTERNRTEDSGTWEWTGTSTDAVFTAAYVTQNEVGKWEDRYQFLSPGTYRYNMLVRPSKAVARWTTHSAKVLGAWNYPDAIRTDRPPCYAHWLYTDGTEMVFNWLDLWVNGHVNIDTTVVSEQLIQVTSPEFVVTQADVDSSRIFIFDPTTTDEADWSADCENNGGNTWYPSDSEDWIGRSASAAQYRTAYKFNIGAVDASHVTSQVDIDINVASVTDDNGADESWFPYGAGGVGDPSGDSAATGWSEIGSRTAYVTNSTIYSSTGHQVQALGSTANSDVDAIRDAAGSVYSICAKGSNETTTDLKIWSPQADTTASLRPLLTVTHAAPAADVTIVLPSAASLTITGQIPTVAATADIPIVMPSAASLTITGQIPTVAATAHQTITLPSAAALTITGQIATVGVTADIPIVMPSAAALTITGQIATVGVTADIPIVMPSAATLTVTGQIPTVAQSANITIALPSAAALTITGQIPTVQAELLVTIAVASPAPPGLRYITAAAQAAVSGTSVTPTISSAGISDGDWLVFIFMSQQHAGTITVPSGYTLARGVDHADGEARLYTKRIADVGTEDFSPTFSHTGAAGPILGYVMACTGNADTGLNDLVGFLPGGKTVSNDDSPAMATVIPSEANTIVLTAMTSPFAYSTYTAPSGFSGDVGQITGGRAFAIGRLAPGSEDVIALDFQTTGGDTTGDHIGLSIELVPSVATTAAKKRGHLRIAGNAPGVEVAANVTISLPSAATLTITGQIPTVVAEAHQTIALPSAASLTVTGQIATVGVTANQTITLPSASSLTLTGQIPTVGVGADVSITLPSAAALTVTGQIATVGVTADIPIVLPSAASLTITGQTATVAFTAHVPIVMTGAASLSLTGFAPSLGQPVTVTLPSASALTITGQIATVQATAHVPIVLPSASALTITSFAPVVEADATIAIPGESSLTITGNAPILGIDQTVVMASEAQLAMLGFAPGVSDGAGIVIELPSVSGLTLTGYAPDLSFPSGATPGGWLPSGWMK